MNKNNDKKNAAFPAADCILPDTMSSCETVLSACIRSLELGGCDVPCRHERIKDLTLQLAQISGISGPDLVPLRWSILLHAIAGMTMPASLRGCADPAAAQVDQVIQHEAWIIETLEPVLALQDALKILAFRHECWNGTGKPNGLKGEAIPLAARVLALTLAWDAGLSGKALTPVECLPLFKARVGDLFDPGLVDALGQIINDQQASQPALAISLKGGVARTAESVSRSVLTKRYSLSSTGAKAQFAVAMALTSVIPFLVFTYISLSGWLGLSTTLEQLWPMMIMVLPFMALGCWMLAKYPVNIVRLRHYMESLTQGVLPEQVSLVTDEDDLSAIELLMRKVVKQTEARVNMIESQTEALLVAERQRVMIEALGTACHHLGQPVTVISGYLEMTRRMALPAEAQTMLEECRVAADAVASILDRLQQMTIYRTEPYLPQTEPKPGASNSDQLIKIW